MRIVFSIIFNGLHHLLHNDQFRFILNNCDKWIVVEGASQSNGSTKWCKQMPPEYHNNGSSIDGTKEFFEELSQQESKLIYVSSNGFWNSKDHQVNRAIDEVKKITDRCFLWQFDIDEQWTLEGMNQAEKEMSENHIKVGAFLSECYCGKNLCPVGEWAGSSGIRRIWDWEGEYFVTHEPPTLFNCEDKSAKLLTPIFKHFNYYFEKDVKFKDAWYSGHEQIHKRWKYINSLPKENFPIHISNLITGYWGTTDTIIEWKD